MFRELSRYELACGGVQEETINNHWVQLWHEAETYHIRMGETGKKWLKWEMFDSGYDDPLWLARQKYSEFKKEIQNGN
ncbi:MAG: hypothetical protein WA061_01820 [Microgenomates group bacterium]